MPIKFKESEKDRTGKETHHYIHTTSLKDLYAAMTNSNTAPKRKNKVRNELVRRGHPLEQSAE
jgi:hypothetical protein